jgi:hypothetical protein
MFTPPANPITLAIYPDPSPQSIPTPSLSHCHKTFTHSRVSFAFAPGNRLCRPPMPRVFFTSDFLEDGVYTCHVRVGFATAHEQRDFLERNRPPNDDGWTISIASHPCQGYNGRPLYQADIRLSAILPPPWRLEFAVSESGPESNGFGNNEKRPDVRQSGYITWEQQASLQKASQALLRQLGVSDLRQGR